MNRDLQTILLSDNPWILDPGAAFRRWLRLRLPSPLLPRCAAAIAGPTQAEWILPSQLTERVEVVFGGKG